MARGILGRKLGMTQVYDENGNIVPVTVIEAGPCFVVQRKLPASDGYSAVQLGFGEVAPAKVNKPESGHFKKAGVKPRRLLREFRVENPEEYAPGQEVRVDIFAPGQLVDVAGISRGKGFAGTIKRHGGHRGPMTHGSKYHRGPGSHGASADPSRVFPGKKLPGRMGGSRVSITGLKVVKVDLEHNLLLVRGSVPGARNSYVEIRESRKAAR